MSENDFIKFLYIFPEFNRSCHVVISNGFSITYSGQLSSLDMYKRFSPTNHVQCNANASVIEKFNRYAFIAIPGFGLSASLDDVKTALIFDCSQRSTFSPKEGHVMQKTVLLLAQVAESDFILIDQKGRHMMAMRKGTSVLPDNFSSLGNRILAHPGIKCPCLSFVLELNGGSDLSYQDYMNFWTCLKKTSSSLYSNSAYLIEDQQPADKGEYMQAGFAIRWMHMGAALAGANLEDEVARCALGYPDERELIEIPPSVPLDRKLRSENPVLEFVTTLLSETNSKSMSTKLVLKDVNETFYMDLGLDDFVTLMNMFGSVSCNVYTMRLNWND